MNPLYCDFETQSAVNLRTVGANAYITHPSTRLMSGAFMDDAGNVTVWVPPDRLPFGKTRLPELERVHWWLEPFFPVALCNGKTLVAHNGELFDELLINRFYPEARGLSWLDTIHLARGCGYPAKLNDLMRVICGQEKEDNTALTALHDVKTAKGHYIYLRGTLPLWQKMLRYNVKDVQYLGEIVKRLLDEHTPDWESIRVHREVNNTGFRINRRHVDNLRSIWDTIRSLAGDAISEITDGELNKDSVRSPQKVKAWLIGKGFFLPGNSLSKQNLTDIFAHPERYTQGMSADDGTAVIALLAQRQNAVSAVAGKLDRMILSSDAGGMVRHCTVYNGAQTTGRDSARDVQIHNFPRGVKVDKDALKQYTELVLKPEWDYPSFQAVASSNKCKPVEMFQTMVRNLIVPTNPDSEFIIYDFSNIEARVLAWLANADSMLSLFSDPHKDIYCDMASRLYGRAITKANKDERFVGKQIVLGCGYQMGHVKFGMSCRALGCDLAKAGVTPEQCVRAYRDAYPQVPSLWRLYNETAMQVVRTRQSAFAGRCTFRMGPSDFLEIMLPSGRVLRYRDCCIVQRESPWRDGELMDQLEYTNGYGFRKYLYGGILTENIDQGVSNDILRAARNRLHDAKRHPVRFTVHDEIVWEVPKKASKRLCPKFGKAMSSVPAWGEGIPVGVEGFVSPVYTKVPLQNTKIYEYLLGNAV